MEVENAKVFNFLTKGYSEEDRKDSIEFFEDSSREDLIRGLSTYIWDNSHGEASEFLEIITNLKKDLPEYFAESLQGAMTGKHDT